MFCRIMLFLRHAAAVILVATLSNQLHDTSARVQDDCECGVASAGLATRIVGGVVTEPNEYPWVVAIFNGGLLHCGGALVTDRHVISAGHCFKWDDEANMNVSLGLHDMKDKWSATMRTISNVQIHEDFTSTSVRDDNDIAIVTLNAPVEFNDKILPICLPPAGTDFGGKLSVIAGWGKMDARRTGSKQLNKALVRIIDANSCEQSKLANHLTKNMLCAFSKGKDGCQGDSGGPLAYETEPGKFIQIGVVSWGIGCANPRYPGIYTNMSNYVDWITANTQDGNTCRN